MNEINELVLNVEDEMWRSCEGWVWDRMDGSVFLVNDVHFRMHDDVRIEVWRQNGEDMGLLVENQIKKDYERNK